MRRRDFIKVIAGSAASWPLIARAQQTHPMRRVGLLMGYPEGDAEGQANLAAFRRGLEELGWIEGRNIQIDVRWGAADPEKAQTLAKELISGAEPGETMRRSVDGGWPGMLERFKSEVEAA